MRDRIVWGKEIEGFNGRKHFPTVKERVELPQRRDKVCELHLLPES